MGKKVVFDLYHHRLLWNGIVKKLKKCLEPVLSSSGVVVDMEIAMIKSVVLEKECLPKARNNCYACDFDYRTNNYGGCESCPFDCDICSGNDSAYTKLSRKHFICNKEDAYEAIHLAEKIRDAKPKPGILTSENPEEDSFDSEQTLYILSSCNEYKERSSFGLIGIFDKSHSIDEIEKGLANEDFTVDSEMLITPENANTLLNYACVETIKLNEHM